MKTKYLVKDVFGSTPRLFSTLKEAVYFIENSEEPCACFYILKVYVKGGF